jgi:FlaA1/EpsC-like NDP-sugar epimerase
MSRTLKNRSKRFIEASRRFFIGLDRPIKSAIVLTTDFLGYGSCAVLAFWLVSDRYIALLEAAIIFSTASSVSILIAWWQGLYGAIVRYMGSDLFASGIRTALVLAVFGASLGYITDLGFSPMRFAVAYSSLAFIFICGSRYVARLFLIKRQSGQDRQRVIIYGAGAAGAELAISLLGSDDYVPISIIDDDPSLHGKRIKGLQVYPPSAIESLIVANRVDSVLLAMPSASRRGRRDVLELLSEFPVHVQTMPGLKDIVSGKAQVDDIKDVDVQDLLGRDPVPPDLKLMDACIKGKVVMVTGAGGSIGSELCYQILKSSPTRLVLFELSEAALYTVERKIRKVARKKDIDCDIVALLGSVHHEHRVREVMKVFGVKTVYHAAAYKHVPMVEHNVFEGIHNNVFGTLYTARAAIDAGAESFVLISTDKAVNPANVMGATKRFAELILQALHTQSTSTKFSMVRFGNVLESSGSVVPLFKEQIKSGGPVTVTHRDIIRYFMTIPEAAQLVIQAGSMATGGDVFVLDMGKPVKILDLAERMISLMGMTVRDSEHPDGDIEIQFVGLRPAEKLYEELLIGSNVSGTGHPRIMRADEDSLAIDVLSDLLDELSQASRDLDFDRARKILLTAVKEYDPQNGIDDLVWVQKTGTDKKLQAPTVVDFPTRDS